MRGRILCRLSVRQIKNGDLCRIWTAFCSSSEATSSKNGFSQERKVTRFQNRKQHTNRFLFLCTSISLKFEASSKVCFRKFLGFIEIAQKFWDFRPGLVQKDFPFEVSKTFPKKYISPQSPKTNTCGDSSEHLF